MKISPIHNYFNIAYSQKNNKKENNINNEYSPNKQFELRAKFNDYMLSFGARVDKGLERFYDVNKDRMPDTVRKYVESLPDKKALSPQEAQKNAFENLQLADSIGDIKELFPDETLFQSLKNPEDTKASRGILQTAKEDAELLALSDMGVLKDKTNLTVYLVKKIFLEAKTIEEINKDLENDLEPDFKADFKFKNPNSPYIYPTTLKALGIKMPAFEYQQSLRYTRDGYSDMVGETISKAQIEFWNALTSEERTARAKKSVENFENWWNSHTRNEKLDLIAGQDNILEMLKDFKKSNRAAKKQQSRTDTQQTSDEIQKGKTDKRVKVGSSVLSQDELFKIWASKNLQIFEATLSEADKDTLHLKRMSRLVQRWQQMTPEEKTDYISKMKSGAEPSRYAMIDAWNNSIDIVKDLSVFLKENQIYKPADLLYSTQEFSQFQSKVMTEFWQTHADHAIMLGDKIRESNQKIETAIQQGTFEELKKQIMRNKNQRIKELAQFKYNIPSENTEITKQAEPLYKKEFKAAYNSHMYGRLKSIPKNFYNDLYARVLDMLPKEAIIAWTKSLRGQYVNEEEKALISKYIAKEMPEVARYNRALEAAMADSIYELTKNPDAYRLSNSDVKTVMYHFEHGEDASIVSHKTGERFDFHIVNNKKINIPRINNLYENYKKDLTKDEINDIMHMYFHLDPQKVNKTDALKEAFEIQKELFDYIQSYGKSALILFSNKSAYPVSVKAKFNEKFLVNMPLELREHIIPEFQTQEDIEQNQTLKRAAFMFIKRFDFLPADFMDVYAKELTVQFKNGQTDDSNLDDFIKRCCSKRKDTKSIAGLAIMPKTGITFESKLKYLAMEQAMADALYSSTGNEDVYSLEVENLADNIELFNLAKKFPTNERRYVPSGNKEEIVLAANKRINLHKIKQLYNEYLEEIQEWLSEANDDYKKLNYEDLLYILNPEENNPKRDWNVAKRMAKYGIKIDKFTIYPNNNTEN